MQETRAEAERELTGMRHALSATLNALASELAGRASQDDVAPIEEIDQVARAFLGTTRRLLGKMCDRLAEGLVLRLAPLQEAAAWGDGAVAGLVQAELATWERSIRVHEVVVGQYTAGWIEGGGVALALMMGLQAGQTTNPDAYKGILKERLTFVHDRAEAAVAQWLDEVQRQLEVLAIQVGNAVAEQQAVAAGAAPADPLKARMEALLDRARSLKVRIRNVPPEPTARYLDKLESQLQSISRKREQQGAAQQARQTRLGDLLSFASELNVRAKGVPDDPSDAWLDRMEAKLLEVAKRKGVELPPGIRPPSVQEARNTLDTPPQRTVTPKKQLSLRIQSLLERAHSADLDLGKIPETPTDVWVASMEARLEEALQERREKRREALARRDSERDDRVERLQQQSAQLGIELGSFPQRPTEEWLTRAELTVASAMLAADAERSASEAHQPTYGQPPGNSDRVRAVLNAASAAGVDLGNIPAQPDEVWLGWAEGRVREAHLEESAIAVDPAEQSHVDAPRAFLVYEEGTVQEQVWMVGADEITIGRSRGNDVQIRDDPAVSRRHAVLRPAGGGFVLSDLQSTKGTMVNQQRIGAEQPLRGGETIQVGATEFVFRVR